MATTLLAIVSEKTGYPAEMLNPDMELEADLGIDSIKRVEILAAFRAAAPDLPDVDPRDLAALRTLRAILDRLGTATAASLPLPPVLPQPAAPQPVPPPAFAALQTDLASTLLGIVSDKTGYPVEMLNPDMELEADLGIDSIKRVEILAAFRAAEPDLPDVDPRDLAALRTLRAILDRLGTANAAAPALPASALPRLGLVLTAAFFPGSSTPRVVEPAGQGP